jgi:hypothetical protein
VLIGKRRGKEADGRPVDGWDFHDWYWRFSMKRRQGKASGGAPHPAAPDALRSHWMQQLGGLKQRAASKRRGQPRPQQEQAAAAAASRSAPWRSATKNARAHQQEHQPAQPPAQPLAFNTAAAPKGSAPGTQFEASTLSSAIPPQPAAEWPADVGGDSSAGAGQLQEILQHAVHAVHEMRHSHNQAVHAHAERVHSHIVAFGQRLRLRLHVHGLRELLHLDASPAFARGAAAGLREDVGSLDGGLHTQFEEAMRSRYVFAGAAHRVGGSREGESESAAPGGPRRAGDVHGRKFADRDVVASRLTGQMAGLKRRAALKREDL